MNAYFLQDFITTNIRLKSGGTSGWRTCNAPCCIHNNETADKKGRGGFYFEATGGIRYNCFNCRYATGWEPGRDISERLKKLLRWFNIPQGNIEVLSFNALEVRLSGEYEEKEQQVAVAPQSFPEFELPKTMRRFSELNDLNQDSAEVIMYAHDRQIDLTKYDIMWDSTFPRQVAVPFEFNGRIVGYSTRSIDFKRFNNYMPEGFVFNVDTQKNKHRRKIIVCEGMFDALTIDCVAVLHNKISETQAAIIESLYKDIVVVPDFDHTGTGLIKDAIEYGWNVSFPVWATDYKDINDAVKELGKLFVLESIFQGTEKYNPKIEMLMKKYCKNKGK